MPETVKLMGEIIAWDCKGLRVPFKDLVAKLEAHLFDAALLRKMRPRTAFSRACRKLAEKRIIRKLEEDKGSVFFQFTREEKKELEYAYDYEATLELKKETGEVFCERMPELAKRAQDELDAQMGVRNAADVSLLVEKVLKSRVDVLTPIKGGCHFLAAKYADELERVDAFFKDVSGRNLIRFPVPEGMSQGSRSVRDALRKTLEDQVAEYRRKIAKLSEVTRESTFEKLAAEIRDTEHLCESYIEYLGSEKERVEAEVKKAREELREKVSRLAAGKAECASTTPAGSAA